MQAFDKTVQLLVDLGLCFMYCRSIIHTQIGMYHYDGERGKCHQAQLFTFIHHLFQVVGNSYFFDEAE